jgi:glycosyltransferase involved in cell wall biosynthesis
MDTLTIAVPDLASYHAHTGIGRLFYSLNTTWRNHARLVDAQLRAHQVPVLRYVPFAVQAPAEADVVFLPQLTQAQALRDTNGIPSVVVVHDIGIVDFPGDREALSWLNYRSLLHSFYGLRYAARIIAVSHFTYNRLLEHLPELAPRLTLIRSGVSEVFTAYQQFVVEARRRIETIARRPLEGPLLIYVGTETPRKNMPLLLRVFRTLKDRYPRAQLLKIGGPGRSHWRTQTLHLCAQFGLSPQHDVLFIERIDDEALAAAYRAADVFVSASGYEGFGMTALEAMAVGTPVVVTNCGAYPEIVSDAGLVVEPELSALASAVERALSNPTHAALSRRGRARAATFSWERAAEQYLDVFSAVRHTMEAAL